MSSTGQSGTVDEEREQLILGWPAGGGVWVLRFKNRDAVSEDPVTIRRLNNALTMDERYNVIEMCGGAFYKNPGESEYVKPLLDGFGNYTNRVTQVDHEL
jgi:hypothetical protein